MNNNREIILLNVSGEDKPGLTHTLTNILAQYGVNILDIGQADIHNTLSLGILFEAPKDKTQGPILKDILFGAYELGIVVKFTAVSEAQYEEWVEMQGKNRYILTLLGRTITAKQLAMVTKVISDQKLNIDDINRLTGRPSLSDLDNPKTSSRSCIEMSVRGFPKDREKMNLCFLELAQKIGIDISFQEDNIYRRNRRLICFDMDSTLIQTEVIDELADRHGVGDQVKAITEAAMRGEIDFNDSFKQRMKLLEGLSEEVLEDIAANLPITEGAERLFITLKRFGFKTAILSGGFTYFGNHLKQKLGVDYVYANELEIKEGKLTGNFIGEIVNGQKKAELMKIIAQFENLNLNQVIAVGDGANDLPMLNLAGLGIAYHAKPKVRSNAKQAIDTIGLDGILYLLGFNDTFIDA